MKDTDDTDVATGQLTEEQVVVFMTDVPDTGKAVPSDRFPMNLVPPEILRGSDNATHIGISLFLSSRSFCVVPDLQQPLTGCWIDLNGHVLVSVLSPP